jgi:class 3 adenylate cyclase/tetratricopeptide (TPR) repeat protein
VRGPSRVSGLFGRSGAVYTSGVVVCPRCGEQNPERARFCLNCGEALGAALRPQEERKLVSVLFVDLVGFTAQSDRADPEDVRDKLQLYHSRAKGEIGRYEGTVDKFIGDAVMAVFGAPLSHADDAERAVRAGLRVLETIQELNQEHPGLELAARAAVNTGEAVVSVDAKPGDAMVMGDVVNTASRLQNAAPAGRLIVGAETYRSTRGVIRYEPIDPVEAKGKAQPVEAWLAVAPTGEPAERPSQATPFVGRDREMALVESIWDRAVGDHRPHLITVVGPPGIGKSRLSREISAFVQERGGRVVRGRCLPYEARDIYGAFAQHVKQVAGIFEHDRPDVARNKLERLASSLLPKQETSDCIRCLSLILGLGLDDPVDEQVVLFYSSRRLVERLGLERPTLFVFEDVHWADSSQLDLLEYLASHVRDTSAVLVALARPEFLDSRKGWGGGLAAHTTIALDPLSARDASVVTSHLLGDGNGAGPAVQRLVEVAEGNPLFLEELAAAVAEGADPTAELPTNVRAAIASRIDALPPKHRAVLLDASVIGKTFWRGALRALGSADGLAEALEGLEARNLVRREPSSQVQGDVEYTFKHILIRDAAYATLPRAARRERHAAVARYIEEAAAEQARELAWLLAHHWQEASEPARAIDYLLIAADRARQAWATDEAVELYAAALDLAEDGKERLRIRLLRGQALAALEEYERAADELGELIPELEGIDQLEALLARGRATTWTEQSGETLSVGEQAIRLAEALGAKELFGPATARLSHGYGMRGGPGDLHRALETGERALALWVPGTRTPELAEHHHLQADHTYWTGRYADALEHSRRAKELASDPGSVEVLLRGGGMEGLALTALGRYEEAFALFEAKIALGRELGRPVRVLLNYSTMAFRDIFDLGEARRRNEEALEQSGWSGFAMPRLNSLVDILFADLEAGEVGRAEAQWPSFWDEVRQGKAWEGWLLVGKMALARADVALRTGDMDTALDWAARTVDVSTSSGRRKYEGAGRSILGRCLLEMGRAAEALTELRTAVSIADVLGSSPGRWRSRVELAQALYTTGDDDGAEQAYREAAEVIRTMASGLSPGHRASFLSAALVAETLKAAG